MYSKRRSRFNESRSAPDICRTFEGFRLRCAFTQPRTPPRVSRLPQSAINMPTMKAWQASAYGAEGNPADTIANLKLADVEIPSAGAGQIQVKVSHAALNPIDWKLFSGGLHGICPCTFPYVPGFDILGEVTAVGEGAYLRQHARRASGRSCRSQKDHETTDVACVFVRDTLANRHDRGFSRKRSFFEGLAFFFTENVPERRSHAFAPLHASSSRCVRLPGGRQSVRGPRSC